MVMCQMEPPLIPQPSEPTRSQQKEAQKQPKPEKDAPESRRSTPNSPGFRLLDDQNETGSVYSFYKQKIDAMFESDSSSTTRNSIQAKIEKMFTDVALDNGIIIQNNNIGCHSFSVDYLGSIPLTEKVTSLTGLQSPLKELYFAYKRNVKLKNSLTGHLEISNSGLKVQYQGEKGDLEQLNSYPTIAVWSAVKFVFNEETKSYAFLPLITDPDNIDKKTLFRQLDFNEKKYINREAHSPLFAVVMRKIGVHKQLECHGFVCQTSEDAIVIAATLYKSLMAHMKAKERKPKNKNGITCMSIGSSAYNESPSNLVPVRPPRKKRSSTSSVTSDRDVFDVADTQPLIAETASKQQKKSSKTRKSQKAPDPPQQQQQQQEKQNTFKKQQQKKQQQKQKQLDLDAILPYEEAIAQQQQQQQQNQKQNQEEIKEIKPQTLTEKWNSYMSNQQKQIAAEIKQVISEAPNRGLKRVQSVRKREEEILSKTSEISGDILTKVTIPRSGSFLNAGGLTRYKSKVCRANGQASGGSPLGFNELFNEFRLQEGLHSMDEILGVIIDAEGMSFNDLKPIYKEFLLKLAVTLTKDELYQRSKSIMRRQKKKSIRRPHFQPQQKKLRPIVVGSKLKRLKHIFRKSFKLPTKKKRIAMMMKRDLTRETKRVDDDNKLLESSISTSSYDTRQFRPKERLNYKKRDYHNHHYQSRRRERASTSEESDFFSLRRTGKGRNLGGNTQNRNSSSGYVSCSECSYDSDTCTCISADKCYCSLGNSRNFNGKTKRFAHKCALSTCKSNERCYCSFDNSLTYCGCDTDSCTDSNKCYCLSRNATIFEQLKQRGFIPSPESIMTPPMHRKLTNKMSNTKSSKSLEYMPNPSEKYYEKLRPKSYENESFHALNYQKALRAYSESGGYQALKHGSLRSYHSAQYAPRGKTVKSTAIPAEGCTEALSVKKSAEIAALFADIKLSQTTDIAHLVARNFETENMIPSSRNAYKNIAPPKTYAKLKKSEPKLPPPFGGRMVNNPLYNSTKKSHNNNNNNVTNNVMSKNSKNLYSTRNGLYTIQSQSDESRRSSVSERGRKESRDYFLLEPQNNISSSLENSLGYLP